AVFALVIATSCKGEHLCAVHGPWLTRKPAHASGRTLFGKLFVQFLGWLPVFFQCRSLKLALFSQGFARSRRALVHTWVVKKPMKKARSLRAYKVGKKGSVLQKIMQGKQGFIR